MGKYRGLAIICRKKGLGSREIMDFVILDLF